MNQTAAHTDTDIKLLSYITFNHYSKGAVNTISIFGWSTIKQVSWPQVFRGVTNTGDLPLFYCWLEEFNLSNNNERTSVTCGFIIFVFDEASKSNYEIFIILTNKKAMEQI